MTNADNDDMPKEINIYKIGKFLYSYRNYKIYAGTNSFTKEEVTIKTINKKYIQGNPKSLSFLNNDVLFTKILSHHNILRLLETYETTYYVFIIMENFRGEFLSSFMNRHKKLEESKALNIFCKLISAMTYIHNMKICHLNINLDSILIDENDENLIKIYDFKNGQYYYSGFKTISDNLGSSMFTCPEMFSIDSYFPELADIWSCGIILCYLLTGEFPINPDKELDLEERYIIPNSISKDLQGLLKKILEFDINKRYKFNDILNSKYFNSHNYATEITEEINRSYNLEDTNLRKIYERYLKQKVRLGKEDHPNALIDFEIIIKRENLPDNKRMSKLIEMFGKVEDTNANLVPKRKNNKNNKKKDKNSEKKENEQKLINNSDKKENSLPIKKKDTFTDFKFNKDKVALRTNKLKGGVFKKGVKGKRKSFFELYNRFSKKSFLFEIPESLITEREVFNNFNQFQTKIQENISNDFAGRKYLKKNTNVANNFKFLGPKISSSVGRRRKSQFAVVREKYADFELFTKINNQKKLKKIEEEKKNNKSNNNEDENIDSINESTKNLHFNGNNNKSVFNFDEAYEEGEESDKNKSFNSNSEGKENGNLNEDNINISQKSSHLSNNEKNAKSSNDNNVNNLNNINNNVNEQENNKNKTKCDNENKNIRYITNNLIKINKTDKKDKKNDNKDEKTMTNYKTKNYNKTNLKDNKNKQLLVYSHQKTDRSNKILNKNDKFENNLKNSIKSNYLTNKKRKINEEKNEKNNKEISNSFNKAQNSRLFNSKLDKFKKAEEDDNKVKKNFYNGKLTLNKSSDNITKRDNIRKNNGKNLKINTKLSKNSSLPNNEPKTPTLKGENQNEIETNKIISKIFENTNKLFFNKDKNLITKNIDDEDTNLSPHFFSKNKNGEKKSSIQSQKNHYTSNYFYQKGYGRPSLVSFSSQVVVYSDDSDEDEATREEKKLRLKIHNRQMMNNLKATKVEGEKVIIKKFTSKAKTPDHKGIFKKPTSILKRTKTKKEKIEEKSDDDNISMLENRSFISNKNSIIAKTKTEYKTLEKQPIKKSSSTFDTILKSLKDLNTVVEQNEENDVFSKYMRRKITPDKSIRKIISENEDESGSYGEDESKSKRKRKRKRKGHKKGSIGSESESENEDESDSDSKSDSESSSSSSEASNSEKGNNKVSENSSNMNSDYNSINNCDSEIYNRNLQKLQNQNKTKTNKSNSVKNRILKNLVNKNNNNNVTTKSDSLSNNNSSFYNNYSYRNTTNKDNDDVLNDVDNFNFINDEYNKIKTEMNKQKYTFKKNHINSKSFTLSNGDKHNKTDIEITSEERNHINYDNNKDYLTKIKDNLRNKLINSTADLSEEKVLPFNGCVIDIKYISLRNYEQTVKLLISELKRKGVRYQKIDFNTYKCTKGIRLFYVDIVKIPKNLFYYRFYSKRKFQTNFK